MYDSNSFSKSVPGTLLLIAVLLLAMTNPASAKQDKEGVEYHYNGNLLGTALDNEGNLFVGVSQSAFTDDSGWSYFRLYKCKAGSDSLSLIFTDSVSAVNCFAMNKAGEFFLAGDSYEDIHKSGNRYSAPAGSWIRKYSADFHLLKTERIAWAEIEDMSLAPDGCYFIFKSDTSFSYHSQQSEKRNKSSYYPNLLLLKTDFSLSPFWSTRILNKGMINSASIAANESGCAFTVDNFVDDGFEHNEGGIGFVDRNGKERWHREFNNNMRSGANLNSGVYYLSSLQLTGENSVLVFSRGYTGEYLFLPTDTSSLAAYNDTSAQANAWFWGGIICIDSSGAITWKSEIECESAGFCESANGLMISAEHYYPDAEQQVQTELLSFDMKTGKTKKEKMIPGYSPIIKSGAGWYRIGRIERTMGYYPSEEKFTFQRIDF